MAYKMTVAKKMKVSANQAWQAVCGIGRLDVWFQRIDTCRVEGEGVGARRYMTLKGDAKIIDVITEINTVARRLKYQRVESPFPVSSYWGTVEVFTSFDGRAVVAWTVDFESKPEVSEDVTRTLEAGIGGALNGMEEDLRTQKQ